jgi:hypothetical protein
VKIDSKDAIALRAVVRHGLEVLGRLNASLDSAAGSSTVEERDVIGVG